MSGELVHNHSVAALSIIREPHLSRVHLYGEYEDLVRRLREGSVIKGDSAHVQRNQLEQVRVLQEIEREFKGAEDGIYPPHAGSMIHWAVYGSFARSRGFTEETGGAILVTRISDEQRTEREIYLTSPEFIAERRMYLAQGIASIGFPTTSYNRDFQNISLAIELENVKRRIALKMLPDITDAEASAALGNLYTTEVVKSRSDVHWFWHGDTSFFIPFL